MLPDWAPNLHPLLVHFPISLLVAAAIADVVGLFWRSSQGMRFAAVLLYVAGAIGGLAAYLTGNRAAESVNVPTEAVSTLNEHQDLALYTVIVFGIYAILRVVFYAVKRDLSFLLRLIILLVGIGCQYLVWQTAEHGAELVFEHGVGVVAVERAATALDEQARRQRAVQAAPTLLEDGGFEWTIGPGAGEALTNAFTFVAGSPEDVKATVEADEVGYVLVLDVERGPVLFTAGDSLASVDVQAEVDVTDFSGSVSLVHNVQGPDTYHYLRLENEAVLGRVMGREDERLASGNVQPGTWTTLRATGDQGHFYGYVDGASIGHGHSAAPAPGPGGVRVEGCGILRIRRLSAQAVQ